MGRAPGCRGSCGTRPRNLQADAPRCREAGVARQALRCACGTNEGTSLSTRGLLDEVGSVENTRDSWGC